MAGVFGTNRENKVLSLERGVLDPVFLASNDLGAVSEVVRSYNVVTSRNGVQFKLTVGTSFADVVARGADVIHLRLMETFLERGRLESLMLGDDGVTGDFLSFQRARSISREREVSVVVASREGAKGEERVASLKADGYRLATSVEATAAHALYRLETSLEGLRFGVDDAKLEARSGVPSVGRPTQQSLFTVALTKDGLFRYSAYEGVVPGDYGKFTAKARETAPEVLIRIDEKGGKGLR